MRSIRKSLVVPVVAAAIALLAGVAPAWAKPDEKTTTTTKDESSKKDKSTTSTTNEGSGDTKAGNKDKDKDTTSTTKANGSSVIGGSVSAYGVAVSGGPELAAQPVVKLASCPSADGGALASTSASPALQTGTIAIKSDCTSQNGTNVVRSRVDVAAVKVGSGDEMLTATTAIAACVATGTETQGTSTFQALKIGDQVIDTSKVAPNTKITGGSTLSGVVNEQTHSGDKLTVNALRLSLGSTQIVVGHVECLAALAAPASTTATTTAPPTTKAVKPASTTGSSGKKLATTGRSAISPSLVLAVGALLAGIALQVGNEGLAVLVPGARRRRRQRQAREALTHHSAAGWLPGVGSGPKD